MASTEAQKKAVKKAQSKCDAIMLRPSKEEGAAIRTAAANAGQSNQQYILRATREQMRLDKGEVRIPSSETYNQAVRFVSEALSQVISESEKESYTRDELLQLLTQISSIMKK